MGFLIGILSLIALILLTSFICFLKVFYSFNKKPLKDGEYDIPPGEEYLPYKDKMIKWQKETRDLPSQSFTITTFDGLKLCGKYYEYAPGTPIELMFHGYKGSAERDLGGGVQRCFALKRSALLVDQRGAGKSQGRVITFGVKESKDCLEWVNFMIEHFGKDVKIILTGISMGAATVLMASGRKLPENVVGVLADCGYTSAKEIIEKIITQMKLPKKIVYPFIKLGAKLYGGFNLEEDSPIEAVKHCSVPAIFFHGDKDGFVPFEMSVENYNACSSQKELVLVPGADHGLSFPANEAAYLKTLDEFGRKYWNI